MFKLLKRRKPSERHRQLKDLSCPVLQRIYHHRGVKAEVGWRLPLSRLHHYSGLPDIEQATHLLTEAILQKKQVVIVGDFDVDGATSTALAVQALKAFGLSSVHYLIPDRFAEGYGLTSTIVDRAQTLQAELLVTVDHGTTACEAVTYAKHLGMQVLVTDHHLPGETLPEADAIVNPNLIDAEFPSKHLCGVGVVFYLLCAVRKHLIEVGYLQEPRAPNMRSFLDWVALGTVADMVPLDENNRILIRHGLRVLEEKRASGLGIHAILKSAMRIDDPLSAQLLGFVVAPRLNAAGRLADMSIGVRLLLSSSREEAAKLADQLESLNRERQRTEKQMYTQSLQALEAMNGLKDPPAGIVLYHENWHEGVVGILASRIKELLYRPVIAFAPSQTEAGLLKGSGRSIADLNLRDVLAELKQAHPDILLQFGGHALAVGLTIRREALTMFQQHFCRRLESQLTGVPLYATILSDGDLSSAECSLAVAKGIQEGGPWGEGFALPIFDSDFQLMNYRRVGERHLKLCLARDGTLCYDAIWFNGVESRISGCIGQTIHLAYELSINRFQDREQLQLVVKEVWPSLVAFPVDPAYEAVTDFSSICQM